MRFIVTALGSYGDVHPMVGLASTLSKREHQVLLVSNPHFKDVITRQGLEFLPLGTTDEYHALTSNPNIWHPLHGPRYVFREGLIQHLRPLYELLSHQLDLSEATLVSHPLDVASRVLQEERNITQISVLLAPLSIRSLDATPKMPMLPDWSPRAWKRFYLWFADRAMIDPIVDKPLNELRAEAGLTQPVRRFANDWWYSRHLNLCMWPDWFAQPAQDWPATCETVGFPLWDESSIQDIDAQTSEFVNAGTPPIVFTPGSANIFGREFFETAIEACNLLGRRGILLSKYAENIPGTLPEFVKHVDFAPLQKLLGHAAAWVHHGGIGSTSQGLAAGVPQLVRPLAFDQHDNGQRVVDAGVAKMISPRKFRPRRVADALQQLLENGTCESRCQELATRCDGYQSLQRAAARIEQIAGVEPELAQSATA